MGLAVRQMGTRARRGLSALLVVLAGVVVGGCGSSGATAPSPTDSPVVGVWTGTVTHPIAGAGRAMLTIEQRSGLGPLSGTWEWTFSNPSLNERGILTGFAQENRLRIELTAERSYPCKPERVLHLDGDRTGRQIQGEFFDFDCVHVLIGTIQLSKN